MDEVVCYLDLPAKAAFRGWTVLAVQHVHSSLVQLVEALCAGGAEVSRITVVGKSYSTQPPAVEALRERGVRVVDPLQMRDPRRSYEEELNRRVEQTVEQLRSAFGMDGPLLVIDEGAVATKVLARRPELAANVCVVEQTTRGARWVAATSLPFPVVDVARSPAKAALEGPLVAGSMVSGLATVLPLLDRTPRRAGIVGYGRMGARLATLLASRFEVVVHDLDAGNAAAAGIDGLPVAEFNELLDAVDLLVGCTGNPILDEVRLDRAGRPLILANCASSDIEFAIWDHRRVETMLPCSTGDPDQPWRNHYAIRLTHPHVLLAGGFPINFHPPGEPISPHDFQVTRALMLAGAVQAINQESTGLAPLGADVQRVVAAAYEVDGSAIGALER